MTLIGRGARRTPRAPRAQLLAAALMFSAGMHAALVPEHLKEMPPLGWSFVAAAVAGAALALTLISRPADLVVIRAAVLFLAFQVLAWVLFVTLAVPGFAGTPEPVETIALVCKAAELFGIAVALPLAWPGLGQVGAARVGDARIGEHVDQRRLA